MNDPKEAKFKHFRYSAQFLFLVAQLREFNEDDFRNWWHKKLVIGSTNLVEYLKELDAVRNHPEKKDW